MSTDELLSRIERRAEELRLYSTKKSMPVLLIVATALIVLGLLFWGLNKNGYFIIGSDNSTIVGSISNFTINQAPMRQWSQLSASEREKIKQEAIEKFPQIRNIGQGIEWAPISKWMAEEKHVTHSNPRDLFRER